MDKAPRVKRETKNKIRVDFERAPLWQRFKAKFLSMNFLKKVVFVIFKIVLLLGISYVILFPYISKIFHSFMSQSDFKDVTVVLISKSPTFAQYRFIVTENGYIGALIRTFLLSATTAIIQTFICALVAYGLAKFKFKGNFVVFALVIATLMIPMEPITYAMTQYFNACDNGVKEALKVVSTWLGRAEPIEPLFTFSNSYIPMYIMSFTGLGFRNGLFIFMLRQFFMGVPDELEESAYVDGSSTMKTFFKIILPISIPMLVTVFIFSFAWQWTDDFFVKTFFDSIYLTNNGYPNLGRIVAIPPSLKNASKDLEAYQNAIKGTATILIALPLIIAYVFLQNKIVQGVERSGIVG